jgi:glycosyltransferase involved in cell wall biosynthesis
MPKVSVLIPVYNAERWVGAALESVLNQTWRDIEIIAVDDGSTDNGLSVMRRYQSACVKIISQSNAGAAAARNLALTHAQGDFIQYLDADDLLSSDKIEAQVNVLSNCGGTAASVSQARYFFDGKEPEQGILESSGAYDSNDPLQWLIDLLGPDGPFGTVPPGCWLVPRSVIEQSGPWNESLTFDDDGEYFARVALNSKAILGTRQGFHFYRKSGTGTLSGRRSLQAAQSALRATQLKADLILTRTDGIRARRALANQFINCAIAWYPQFPAVTNAALRAAKDLGGTTYMPPFVSPPWNRVIPIVGWKAVRRMSFYYHHYLTGRV